MIFFDGMFLPLESPDSHMTTGFRCEGVWLGLFTFEMSFCKSAEESLATAQISREARADSAFS